MDKGKLIMLFLALGNVVFLGAAVYYHLDQVDLNRQIDKLETERAVTAASLEAAENKLALVQRQPAEESKDGNSDMADLEQQLSAKEQELVNLRQQLDDLADGVRNAERRGEFGRNRNRRESMEDRMERLREENPERYERMMAAREEMQKRRQEFQNRRSNFFNNLDTSRMSRAQRQTVAEYKELLAQIEAGEGNRETFGQMMRLNQDVRDALFSNLSDKLGVSSDSLNSGVQEILEMTGPGFGGPGPGGFGGGPGFGGPGFGPGGFGGGPGGPRR